MKKSSKYTKIEIVILLLLLLSTIIGSFALVLIIDNATEDEIEEKMKQSDIFSIDSYKVVLDVKENNSIDVKEYITVNFKETGYHGIYRFIPYWLEYTGKDNKTISRKAIVSDLTSYSDSYSIGKTNGKPHIRLGNSNKTVPFGIHTYEIGYTYDMGKDPYEDFDEFIFHAFGDYWKTKIWNASLEVHFPKSFSTIDNIHFYADKYRKKDVTSRIDYYVLDNTLYAKVLPQYTLSKALTIDVELPKGYFKNENNNYGNISFIICIICISFAVISYLLWFKNRKEIPKDSETVEFYPPENLDASQIAYLYKKDTGRKLTIALILELASKGFIKINEPEDKDKRKITIVKSDFTDVNVGINRKIKISKIKDYDYNFIRHFSNKHSKNWKLMKKYFDNSDEYTIINKFDEFYKNADYLIKQNYIKVETDTINNYSKEELENIEKSLHEKTFKDKPKMTENEELVYNELFVDGDEIVLFENKKFYDVFSKIALNLRNELDEKIYDLKGQKNMLIATIGFTICVTLWGVACCYIEDLNSKLRFMYVLGAIANCVTLRLIFLMQRKNDYGEEITSKIEGFKKHIELADKNQIDMLVKQNPNYFYDILPYAYVLDVSKKWDEKFEKKPIPTKNMGNFDYYNTDSLNDLSSAIYKSSSSGGCSSCGGGCSSCGGGCSSCGGGGGW